nr:hypothetical protein GZ27A8_25 [uncultured archaeon GZfos27A8]
MDISGRSPHPETCMRVVCQHRCIIIDKVSSHLILRCRLNLSRVFLLSVLLTDYK